MIAFLLWLVLLVIAWPLAILALVLIPVVWLLSIPFRVIGISVRGLLDLLAAALRFPARLLRGPQAAG